MDERATETRWERLTLLLEPIHAQAITTARRLCRHAADGDDLYQETVLRAFQKLDALRDEASFRPWFFSILLSRHRTRSRRPFWRRFLSLDAQRETGREPVGERGEEWADRMLRAERIARALGHLPDVQREAIVLFEMQDFSIEEIAAVQRASVSAVKTRLMRGRAALRREYERRGWVPSAPEAPPARPFERGAAISTVVLAARENVHDR